MFGFPKTSRALSPSCSEKNRREALSAVLASNTDRAVDLIEKLIPQPGFLTVWKLRLDQLYNPLRSNQRFQALLSKGMSSAK